MYIDEIIAELKEIDNAIAKGKKYGKIVIEINYQNGIYVNDVVCLNETKKRKRQ
jgi:hypothetical protein